MNQAIGDILVLPFFGTGHLFPFSELSENLSSFNWKSIFIIPSHLSSSIPSSLYEHPLIEVLQISASYSPPPQSPTATPQGEESRFRTGPKPVQAHHKELGDGIDAFLAKRYKNNSGQIRPGCVVMDVMMSWSQEIFIREKIPIVSFITSGACSTAIEYAAWKDGVEDMKPGETRILSGLPESLALSYSDLTRRDHKKPKHNVSAGPGPAKPVGPPGGMSFGPRQPGQPPRWSEDAEGWAAMLLNTCNELEGPFVEYLARQMGKPVFGVGPLLPKKYWKSTGSIIHDQDSRPDRESDYKEDEIIQWLDSKPRQSVIYVSFGSEVGPTMEEYAELAEALRESKWSFIWVIQPGSGKTGPSPNFVGAKNGPNAKEEGYYPHGLEEKVGERGLVIKGWAPQLMILSHPSTGGFLSHCGWNSTIEAIGRGIPILAWPIRGDQFYNADWIVKYLKAGYTVLNGENLSEMVKNSDIVRGIETLMEDKEVHERAMKMAGIFEAGYPASSSASLKKLIELISM